MSPGGQVRAAAWQLLQTRLPLFCLGHKPNSKPLLLGQPHPQGGSASHRHPVHLGGSSSCTRKGVPRRSNPRSEGGGRPGHLDSGRGEAITPQTTTTLAQEEAGPLLCSQRLYCGASGAQTSCSDDCPEIG